MDFIKIEVDYKNGKTIKEIALENGLTVSTMRRQMIANGIEIRPRGGINTNMHDAIEKNKDKIKVKKGYHMEVISKDGKFKSPDYVNSSGALSSYLKKQLGIEVPTLYVRKKYESENRKSWFSQYFDFIEVKDAEVKKCPYCDWETVDVENRSGAFEQHLLKVHNKNAEEYLKEFPQDKDFFKSYVKKEDRKKELKNDGYSITCPICGENMKKITLWHMKSKHNMTLKELRDKYPFLKVVSDYSHMVDEENFKLGNLHASKHRFISIYERELQDFLEKNNLEFECNRQILIGKEIDMLIPSKKIGIEFDGLKWHTEFFGHKDRNYHVNKTNRCKEHGYSLIHIFEDEYVNKKELVYHKISHLLHLNNDLPKIQGRKIEVCEIYMNDAKEFLNKFHIQGFASSSVYLGGFYKGQLIAVMAFKHGNIKNPNWELTRFATDFNYIYQGVGSKLFTHFIRKYNPYTVISFADRRWTLNESDNLYTKLGFKLESINKPDYRYYNEKVDRFKRIHKMVLNKQTLHKKYGFPLTMTESEMTKELGYDRIWDCGLFKYVWTRAE